MGVAAAWTLLLVLGMTTAPLASSPASVAPAIERRSARVEMRLRGFTRRVSFQAVTKARRVPQHPPRDSLVGNPAVISVEREPWLASPFHNGFAFVVGGRVCESPSAL